MISTDLWSAYDRAISAILDVTDAAEPDEAEARMRRGFEAAVLDGEPRRDMAMLIDYSMIDGFRMEVGCTPEEAGAFIKCAYRFVIGAELSRDIVDNLARRAYWYDQGRRSVTAKETRS